MSDLIGKKLGPYLILEQIGAGGMATVYRAYHAATDRFVAVKVLPEQQGWDSARRRRFEREAKVIAKLEHAHILPVYDYGEDEGYRYLVMRCIDAGTLKERTDAGPMDLIEIRRVLDQVGGALAYAHRNNVVHRDVKPSNVLLDNQGDCYLSDFGVAKMMEASTQLTATGVGLGTPAYMSPEQGQGKKPDARSDIYSLGVMLYEMVTGRVPFQAETPMAVVLQHINKPLPLPRKIKPDVPEAVERVILKALAKDPDDRYQTVGEAVAAFDAAVQPAATGMSEPGLLGRAVVGVQSNLPAGWSRILPWAVGGVILLVALFCILSRIPLEVQISGGRVDVVRMVEETVTPKAKMTTKAAATLPLPSAFPVAGVDTGMGGDLTIRGIVRDSSGNVAPDVYVSVKVYDKGGGWHFGKRGEWGLYTEDTGAFSFSGLPRVEEGIYEVWFNGDQEYGQVYENSGYQISENEIRGNVHTLEVTVHPVTGSAFSGVIRYEDIDGSIEDFYPAPLREPAPDRFIALQRGRGDDDFEYAIGAEYYAIEGNTLDVNGLAGGRYYLQFTYRRQDGMLVYCTSPAFAVPAGETTQFEYTIRDCPPTAASLPTGAVDTGMGGNLSIQGIVHDDAGNPVPNIHVEVIAHEGGVYWELGGSDHRQLGRWIHYTDETGFYAFKNLERVKGGQYTVWFSGGERFGVAYESSGYYIMEDEGGGHPYLLMADDASRARLSHDDGRDEHIYALNVAVYPATGSALSAIIQYEDSDGQTKNYFSKPLGPDHRIELNRGASPDEHEYTIEGGHFTTDDGNGYLSGLAGGTYYLVFQYLRSDGVWVDRISPPFEILPGETKRFEYTIALNP